jgi:hypothetical protein
MDARWGVGKWLPLPRFQIVQASGKKRPIDDGARNSHNEMVRYSETLDCPSPVQPAVQLRALTAALMERGLTPAQLNQRAETGTEDMPDAYRFVPIRPDELAQNIVAVWDPETGKPMFQEIYGHVFGKSAAVVNFHRLQRLLTSAARRLLGLLIAFYYDDATLQDLSSAKGRGQRYLRGFFRLLGRTLSSEKSVPLQTCADYLGLRHDVSRAMSEGLIEFEPRAKLQEKIAQAIQCVRSAGKLSPAEASKLRGVMQFMATGVFGRVGAGGMSALVRRQYADSPPYRLTPEIAAALRYFEDVMALPLRREARLWARGSPPLIIASDGRLDSSAPASIATLIVDPASGTRVAFLAYVPAELRDRWKSKEQYIAHVEQAALVMVVMTDCYPLRGRDAFWFIDNSVVLSAMVKGTSSEPDLARATAALHLALAARSCRMWFEYVESDSNWADEPSRKLWESEFLHRHGFEAKPGYVPAWPWSEEDGRVARIFPLHTQRWEGQHLSALGQLTPPDIERASNATLSLIKRSAVA